MEIYLHITDIVWYLRHKVKWRRSHSIRNFNIVLNQNLINELLCKTLNSNG